jgi:hypothetical protein
MNCFNMSRIWNPKVVELAKRSRDESIPPAERLYALYMLAMFAELGAITCDAPKENKPEFVWRNGAKVRVK